jgi:hypothetical protein
MLPSLDPLSAHESSSAERVNVLEARGRGLRTEDAECDVTDQEILAALNRHWAASDSGDFKTEHELYHDDAVLGYPQSRERIRGRSNI